MDSQRWPLITLALLVVAVALGYLANPIVPIFLLVVVGLPVGLWLLNRSPRSSKDLGAG